MKKIYFVFGIHIHQPVGNFPEVFQKATELSYRPFLEMLYKYPEIKCTLHSSGILFEYFEKEAPDIIRLIKEMVERGQVEILSGGFYEPILLSLLDIDKIGQIKKFNKYIQKKFGVKPNGLWLAERVWEPHLTKIISESDLQYTILDDYHFISSGVSEEKLRGYYITEEQGYTLKIFPMSKQLRYLIPFRSVEDVISHFKKNATDEKNELLTLVDDGEKFGIWPHTHKHVYINGWLENFFNALRKNSNWIISTTPSEFLNLNPPKDRIYLQNASYFEMTEWSLPQEAGEEFEELQVRYRSEKNLLKFFKGGFWRTFLTKYPEANDMHKKMIYISQKVHKLKIKPQKVLDKLWSGQCSCAYWHGIFGGLYLPHLRTAIYKNLIEAEKFVDKKEDLQNRIQIFDLNCDGRPEVLFEAKNQNIYFIPHLGAGIFEWDIKSKNLNISNVLTRRKEAYHKKLLKILKGPSGENTEVKTIHELLGAKEKDLDKYLHYDWYRKLSLIDHFLHPDTKFEDFKKCQYGEQGDFVVGEYDFSHNSLEFSRTGIVWVDEKPVKTKLVKKIIPSTQTHGGCEIEYIIENLSDGETFYIFAPEFNFLVSYFEEKDEGEFSSNRWHFVDKEFDLEFNIDFGREVQFFLFPIFTVSISESGFERTYQGVTVLPIYKFFVKENQSQKLSLKISFNED